MCVLITGASGFVGVNLASRLINEGREVRCLIRNTSNISNLLKINKLELINGDLFDEESLQKAVKDIKTVYHLAGAVHSSKISDLYKTNFLGTQNLLKACINANISKFIYLSSIAVNKPPTEKTLINENSPIGPITPYGKSKYEAEKIILEFGSKYNLPFVIIRAPVIYGPQQPHILTEIFLKIIQSQKSFLVKGGNNLRSLCYVDNLIDGMLLAEKEDRAIGQIYILSDKEVYTFIKILYSIANLCNVELTKKSIPPLLIEILWIYCNLLNKVFGLYSIKLYSAKTLVLNLGCDISKAERELGYRPTINLEEGLRKTIDWIKEEYKLELIHEYQKINN